MNKPQSSPQIVQLSELPLNQAGFLLEILDIQLAQQLLHLGIEPGSRVERLTRGQGMQPLILNFDGLTLALLPKAADLIRVEA